MLGAKCNLLVKHTATDAVVLTWQRLHAIKLHMVAVLLSAELK